MVYRKTESVLARIEAKRDLIITSAIAVISIAGVETVTMEAVANQAGIAQGLAYKYFPDKHELLAHVSQLLLNRDLADMRARAIEHADPIQALAVSISVFYARLKNAHVVKAMAASEIHRLGMRAELERLLRATDLDLGPTDQALAAAGALGAVYGVFFAAGRRSKNGAPMALLFALRGIGVPEKAARAIIAKGWGYSMAEAL